MIGAAFKFPNTCIISIIIFTYLGSIKNVLWDSDVRLIFPWNAKNEYLGCLIWIIVLKRNALGDAHCKIVSDLLTWVSWEWEYTFLSI